MYKIFKRNTERIRNLKRRKNLNVYYSLAICSTLISGLLFRI